jgi:hypothetical protein
MCGKGQQDGGECEHADTGNRTEQHAADNAAEEDQNTDWITEQGDGAVQKIIEDFH